VGQEAVDVSAVTLTGRLVEIPRLSGRTNSRPGVRTTFEIEGLHSGIRVQMHATEEVAERITALSVGDVITATCLSEHRTNRKGDRLHHVLFVESFTRHPREAVCALPDEKPTDEEDDS
jgi:hypothetical protein